MMRCIRCHRTLKDTISQRIGYGPKCFEIVTGYKFPRSGTANSTVGMTEHKVSLESEEIPPLFAASNAEELEAIISGRGEQL